MSSRTSINHLSEQATQETNVPDVKTPILTFQPDNGTMVSLLNDVPAGSSEGLPIYFDLRDEDGDQLPTDTEIQLRVEEPGEDDPIAVSTKETNIASWNELRVSEQRKEDNVDSVKFELKGSRINLSENHVLRFDVEADTAVDWDESQLYVEKDGARKTSM